MPRPLTTPSPVSFQPPSKLHPCKAASLGGATDFVYDEDGNFHRIISTQHTSESDDFNQHATFGNFHRNNRPSARRMSSLVDVTIPADTDEDRSNVAEDAAWQFHSTLAYWSSLFTMVGASLFTVGSICLFPAISHAFSKRKFEGWVDYPFMIGAWCFTAANYLIYYQVINQQVNRLSKSTSLNFIYSGHMLRPQVNFGELGCFSNLIGGLLFNVNTMAMFGIPRVSDAEWNVWYVLTGGVGSLFFVTGAIFEGEHNRWRDWAPSKRGGWRRRLQEVPVWSSVLNFWGGLLFAVAYFADWDRSIDSQCENHHCVGQVWLVAGPFTVGSVFFVMSGWLGLWMWKAQIFGVGFARSLVGNAFKETDMVQHSLLIVYCTNLVLAWLCLGFLVTTPESRQYATGDEWQIQIAQKILFYHWVAFLVSAVHRVPAFHPYDYLVYGIRVICLYSTVADICLLMKLSQHP